MPVIAIVFSTAYLQESAETVGMKYLKTRGIFRNKFGLALGHYLLSNACLWWSRHTALSILLNYLRNRVQLSEATTVSKFLAS